MEKKASAAMVVPSKAMSYSDTLKQIVTVPLITTLGIQYNEAEVGVTEDKSAEDIDVRIGELPEGSDHGLVVKNVQRALDYNRTIAGHPVAVVR